MILAYCLVHFAREWMTCNGCHPRRGPMVRAGLDIVPEIEREMEREGVCVCVARMKWARVAGYSPMTTFQYRSPERSHLKARGCEAPAWLCHGTVFQKVDFLDLSSRLLNVFIHQTGPLIPHLLIGFHLLRPSHHEFILSDTAIRFNHASKRHPG